MKHRLIAMTALSLAAGGLAAAEDTNFCDGSEKCWDLSVENNSSVTVTKVKITQEKTDGACDKDERSYSQNLAGNAGSSTGGDTLELIVDKACKYKVKFSTTSGCTGDKVAHIGPKKFAENAETVELVGGCGTLAARS